MKLFIPVRGCWWMCNMHMCSTLVAIFVLTCSFAMASMPDVNDVTGARINENNIQHVLHVSIDGNDSHPDAGTAAYPYRTINAAAHAACLNQQNHEGTRVVIHPGIYRETVDALKSYPTTGSTGAPVIFEADEPGTVVVSGSEVYTGWVSDGGNDIYSHHWQYDWGLWVNIDEMDGYEKQIFIDYPVLRRREMFFADGRHLRQFLTHGEMQAQENSFYVDEDADKVYINLESGSDVAGITIEAAIRMYLFEAYQNRSIVVRGLIFEHATNTISQGGSHEGQRGAANFHVCEDILFENNITRWNNGTGWSFTGRTVVNGSPVYYCCERLTIRGNVSNYNGIAGAETNITRNTILEDNETSNCNWRGEWGTMTWGWTGTRFYRMHDSIVRRHRSVGNYARGLWFDYDAANVLLADSYLCDNADGLKFEVTEGPFLVRNCEISNNDATGILYHVANDTTLADCVIENNGRSQIFTSTGQLTRYMSNWEGEYPSGYLSVGNLTLLGNIIGGSGTQLLVEVPSYPDFIDTLACDDNYYYHPDSTNVFEVGSTQHTFAGWRNLTGQDANSTFAASSPTPASCGDLGTEYLPEDINTDCRVDLGDLARLAAMWSTDTTEIDIVRTHIIEAWQDTTFDSKSPGSSSGGTSKGLVNYVWNGSGQKRCSLMKFDVSSIDTAILNNIVSVELFINANDYRHSGDPDVSGKVHGWKFHRMLIPWSETDTYNSLNGLRAGIDYDATEFNSYLHDGDDGPGGKYIGGFDTAVQNWLNGTWANYGFIIISYLPDGSTLFNVVSFRSREFDRWQNQNPILYVTVNTRADCNDPQAGRPEDLNGDCHIDLIDIEALGQSWLMSTDPAE